MSAALPRAYIGHEPRVKGRQLRPLVSERATHIASARNGRTSASTLPSLAVSTAANSLQVVQTRQRSPIAVSKAKYLAIYATLAGSSRSSCRSPIFLAKHLCVAWSATRNAWEPIGAICVNQTSPRATSILHSGTTCVRKLWAPQIIMKCNPD